MRDTSNNQAIKQRTSQSINRSIDQSINTKSTKKQLSPSPTEKLLRLYFQVLVVDPPKRGCSCCAHVFQLKPVPLLFSSSTFNSSGDVTLRGPLKRDVWSQQGLINRSIHPSSNQAIKQSKHEANHISDPTEQPTQSQVDQTNPVPLYPTTVMYHTSYVVN